ncbi:MAG TPA: energy transducer TonB [Myxococcaceae bacterium]|jgi:protein TonB
MFQSVIEQKGWRAGRFGTGAGVSVLVHAGIVAALLFVSAGVTMEEPEVKVPPVVVFQPPQPPRGNPNPAKAKPAAQPKPKPKPKKLVQPAVIPPTPPPEVEPPTTPDEPEDELPYIPGSHEDGVDEGGVPGAPAVAGLEQTLTSLEPTGEEVVAFGGGMKAPKRISGAPIQYTREALEARVKGMLVAKCVITREGEVETCKLIKGLPHMDVAVLSALETWRYTPVTWQGKPISVSYIFNIKLEMPY